MEATVQSVQDKQVIAVFERQRDQVSSQCDIVGFSVPLTRKRLLGSVLGQWTAQAVSVKSRELDVVEKRDAAQLGSVLSITSSYVHGLTI
jgi:hypothetical protein